MAGSDAWLHPTQRSSRQRGRSCRRLAKNLGVLAWAVMNALGRLVRLSRHDAFRRMITLRMLTQSGDAVVQVGMAAYILFSPQSQPNAWAVAAVIALVILPFSVVGPFVSPILDRFDRKRTVIVCDLARLVLATTMAVSVVASLVVGRWQVLLFVLLLVTLSLNRLQLAALGAGMPFTVESDEYLEAASVVPMIGPIAAMVGGLLAGVVRLASGRLLAGGWVDGLVFVIAALLFAAAVARCLGFDRRGLGPAADQPRQHWSQVWSQLGEAGRELARRRPAWLGVVMVFGAKTGYGVLMTMMIVLYRHHFGSSDNLEAAMVQLGFWFLVSGAGYALSGLVASPISARFGVRTTLLGALGVAAIVQTAPGALLTRLALVVTGFVIGLCVQSVKVCADTIVQAHIPDGVRGRVMVLYDIVNNLGLVVGALVAAWLLPPDGHSLPVMLGLSAWYVALAVVFGLASRRQTREFDKGTLRYRRRLGKADQG